MLPGETTLTLMLCGAEFRGEPTRQTNQRHLDCREMSATAAATGIGAVDLFSRGSRLRGTWLTAGPISASLRSVALPGHPSKGDLGLLYEMKTSRVRRSE